MPYIKQADRKTIDQLLDPLCAAITAAGASPGEINYIITRVVNAWIKDKVRNYATLNHVVGVLEAAKLEFYRRVVAPYEDDKRAANGDVYGEEPDPRGQKPTVVPAAIPVYCVRVRCCVSTCPNDAEKGSSRCWTCNEVGKPLA